MNEYTLITDCVSHCLDFALLDFFWLIMSKCGCYDTAFCYFMWQVWLRKYYICDKVVSKFFVIVKQFGSIDKLFKIKN